MDLSRQEYPAMLASLQPAQASTVLGERIKQVNKLNADIADWLQERRRVEEAYVAGLRKLSKRQLAEDSSELGIFSTPWSKIVHAIESIAESHHSLAQRIESDVERPLREFTSTNREMQAMPNITGNLNAMAKDVEVAQKKVEKQRDKGGKASTEKVAAAVQELDNAQSQWDSQAPYVFEKLQQIDESRCNHLRDVLTQYQTHEVDQVEKNRTTAEQTLNALLNIETADEIKTWSIRTLDGKPTIERKRSNRPPATPSAAPSSSLSHSTPAIRADDGSSQRSGSVQEKERSHGGLSGLKRLGTVLGKKRQSIHPYGRASSPERKSATNLGPFSSFGNRSGKSKDRQNLAPIESPPASPSRRRSGSHTQSLSQTVSQPAEIPPATPVTRPASQRANGTIPESPVQSTLAPESASASQTLQIPQLQEPLQPTFTGASTTSEPQKEEVYMPPPGPPPSLLANSSSQLDPITLAEQEASEHTTPFKVDIRNAPIQEEDGDSEAAIASVANTLRAQAAPIRKTGTIRGRRDVRNTMFVPSNQPIPLEIAPTATAAIAPAAIATTAAIAAPAAPAASPTAAAIAPAPMNTDVAPAAASAALSPVPASPPPAPHSPFRPTHRATFLSEDTTHSDTQSVRSGRSLSSAASVAQVKHPDMHAVGLNASVVEFTNVTFDNGTLTKASTHGEIAMVYNPSDLAAPAPFGTESIQLENFPILEKVAPNPAFIENIAEKPGFYAINLSSITKTNVAFKYQLHLEESTLATYAPLQLTPAWKCEEKHSSVIFSYGLNPNFPLGDATSVTLSNVVIVIHLDGAKATHSQSKPEGVFSKERSLIYWRVNELILKPDTPHLQVRARFFTESEGKPGKCEARWEATGEAGRVIGSKLRVSMMTHEEEKESSDPFADEGGDGAVTPRGVWKEINTVTKVSSGLYEAVSSA